ncbi:MAG TPA: transposase, partial [Actinomycetota bacterium]|nr:transposase [Actinomycetota bacterium]
MQLTPSFRSLLLRFRPVFTAPTLSTFLYIATGWCLSHRHRYVTELIQSSGAVHRGHHSRYHRFFSDAAWSIDELYEALARQAVASFYPEGTIELGVDDTLARKRGLTIFGTGMHHDPLISSRARPHVSWGHDWVILSLIIPKPAWSPTKVWALPVAIRLYKNRQGLTKGKNGPRGKAKAEAEPKRPPDPNHRTRPELAVELIGRFARWFPGRKVLVSGDSAYGGKSVLRHLPKDVDLISRVAPNAALYRPAPPRRPDQKGASRKKGDRLPGMAEWAADATAWEDLEFDQYGLHAELKAKTIRALYYKAGKDRLLSIVLARDTAGGRPDQMFSCTRTDWDARTILSHYANRWSVEVMHFNAKQMMGLEDPSNRTPLAVQRTAPVGLVLYGLTLVWFHRDGHRSVSFPDRPWYPGKEEPSYADILTALRRESWRGQ